MEWVNVMAESDLAEGEKMAVPVQGHLLLLVRFRGRLYATDARCPHMGGHLERGRLLEDGSIECPRHHSVFDLATGDVKAWAPWPPVIGTVLGAVKPRQPLATYPLRVEQGMIQVGLEGS